MATRDSTTAGSLACSIQEVGFRLKGIAGALFALDGDIHTDTTQGLALVMYDQIKQLEEISSKVASCGAEAVQR